MPSKIYFILRSERSERLEGRTVALQSDPGPQSHSRQTCAAGDLFSAEMISNPDA
jgi:hypothetical protein